MSELFGEWNKTTHPSVIFPKLGKVKKKLWIFKLRKALKHSDKEIRGRGVIALAVWQNSDKSQPFNQFVYQQNFWEFICHSLKGHTIRGAIERWSLFAPLALELCSPHISPYNIMDIILSDQSSDDFIENAFILLGQIEPSITRQTASNLLNHPSPRIKFLAGEYLGLQANESSPISQNPSNITKSSSPSVLILEDATESAELIQATLKRMGIVSVHAPGGGEALGTFNDMLPDLILLDISLPDMTGWEFLETLKEKHKGQMPIVIVMSAYDDPSNRLVGKLQGVHDYLSKPFGPIELERIVLSALQISSK